MKLPPRSATAAASAATTTAATTTATTTTTTTATAACVRTGDILPTEVPFLEHRRLVLRSEGCPFGRALARPNTLVGVVLIGGKEKHSHLLGIMHFNFAD
jgi:hypothetical protein